MSLKKTLQVISILAISLIYKPLFSQNITSIKNNNEVFDFLQANKNIDFDKVWDYKKQGVYGGNIIKTRQSSNPSFDKKEIEESGKIIETSNFLIYPDCSEIYAFNKKTKSFFQIWYINIQHLRDCWDIELKTIQDDKVLINYYSEKVTIEIDLKSLKYRVLVR